MSEVTVVFSDLHANARALRAAVADATTRGFDRLVVLGDLLTYGLDRDEVIDLVASLVDTAGAAVVTGNHDQLYFDLAEGERGYYEGLPAWLRETADHTLEGLDVAAFRARFSWRPSVTEGPWLLAHANPFTFGDWRYLYTPSDARDAARALRAQGMVGGVFGHTHRRFAMAFSQQELELDARVEDDRSYDVDLSGMTSESTGRVFVLNPGSVGQPRHKDRASTYLRITRDRGRVSIEHVPVTYDVAAHLRGLRGCAMSEATREKLCGFFEGAR